MATQPLTNAALPGVLPPSLPLHQPAAPATPASAKALESGQRVEPLRESNSVSGTEKSGDPASSPGRAELEEALKKVQKAVEPVAQHLLFSIDEDTGKTIVKVVDSSTKETIRQIPSEELLSIAKALDKLQGLLIKQEV